MPALAQPRGSWVLEAASDLPDAREHLRQEIGGRGQPAGYAFALADPVERVLLASTELAGNAIRHAVPPVTLQLLRSARGWLVRVTDAHPGSPPVQPEQATATGQGRRGLLIVDALSGETGWYPDGDVKHVWAFVPDQPPDRLVQTLRPSGLG